MVVRIRPGNNSKLILCSVYSDSMVKVLIFLTGDGLGWRRFIADAHVSLSNVLCVTTPPPQQSYADLLQAAAYDDHASSDNLLNLTCQIYTVTSLVSACACMCVPSLSRSSLSCHMLSYFSFKGSTIAREQ